MQIVQQPLLVLLLCFQFALHILGLVLVLDCLDHLRPTQHLKPVLKLFDWLIARYQVGNLRLDRSTAHGLDVPVEDELLNYRPQFRTLFRFELRHYHCISIMPNQLRS